MGTTKKSPSAESPLASACRSIASRTAPAARNGARRRQSSGNASSSDSAAVATVSASVAAAGAALGRAGGTAYQTLDTVGVPTAQRMKLDVAPKGHSPGDQGFRVGDVYAHGELVGRYQGTCTIPPRSSSQCAFTVGLVGGQIVLQAGYGPKLNGDSVVREPVVGGSGAYEGVRGEGVDLEQDGKDIVRLRLRR
jgi:hypothetical protein